MFANDKELFSTGVTVGEILTDMHGELVRPVKCNTCGEEFAIKINDYTGEHPGAILCPNKCNNLFPPKDIATLLRVRWLNEVLEIAGCGNFDDIEDFDEFNCCIQRLKDGMLVEGYKSESLRADWLYLNNVLDGRLDTEMIPKDISGLSENIKVHIGSVVIREEAADYIGRGYVVESPIPGVFSGIYKDEIIYCDGNRCIVARVA